jgi:hypothetical protein
VPRGLSGWPAAAAEGRVDDRGSGVLLVHAADARSGRHDRVDLVEDVVREFDVGGRQQVVELRR